MPVLTGKAVTTGSTSYIRAVDVCRPLEIADDKRTTRGSDVGEQTTSEKRATRCGEKLREGDESNGSTTRGGEREERGTREKRLGRGVRMTRAMRGQCEIEGDKR